MERTRCSSVWDALHQWLWMLRALSPAWRYVEMQEMYFVYGRLAIGRSFVLLRVVDTKQRSLRGQKKLRLMSAEA